MTLTLGFSPCPNDTFIFDALVNGKINTGDLSFDYVMEDVETLNQWAVAGRLDITKLSFATFMQVTDKYALLKSGSALGRGVGPLLISKNELTGSLDDFLNKASIAIPGKHTTANLLMSLAFPEAMNKTEVIFSEIEEKVLNGTFDAGLIIHESRFTYAQKGLQRLMDLGDWWEHETGSAIPLGGIVMKRNHPHELCARVDSLIRESVAYSWQQYPNLSPFISDNSQEMEEEVMRQHIQLYVNEYTTDLGEHGHAAIDTLFSKAAQNGLIPADVRSENIWY